MFTRIFQKNIGRLHILLAKNDAILDNIQKGVQNKRSLHFDHLNGQVFFSIRIGHRFINIDWV